MESKDQECREDVTVKLGKCKSLTAMVDHMQKYHKDEWVELHKVGLRQQSIKSFIEQHIPKKEQSQPAEGISVTEHASLEIGVVDRPDSSSGATGHAASAARFAHLKDIFAPKETTKVTTTEGGQGEMRIHFKPKEQGWTTFREMVGALNTNAKILSSNTLPARASFLGYHFDFLPC